MGVEVGVEVDVDVGVTVGVAVAVGVGVMVGVGMNVGEGVSVGVGVAVDVGVAVGVGSGVLHATRSHTARAKPVTQSGSLFWSISSSLCCCSGDASCSQNPCSACT